MKTIYVFSVFLMVILISVVGCSQQTTPDSMMEKDASIQKDDSMMNDGTEKGSMGNSMGDGYELKEAKMMIVKETTHEMMAMQNDAVLKDGTKVLTSGKVIRPDGSSFMLKEGESMWMDGSFMEAQAMMDEGSDDDSMMEKTDSLNSPEQLSTNYYRYDKAHFEQSRKEGKIIFLDFHADWCPICQNERPGILEAFRELNDPNVVGYEVHFNDKQTTDEDNEAIKQYQITYQHTKVFIKDGKVVKKSLEKLTKVDILEILKEVTNG